MSTIVISDRDSAGISLGVRPANERRRYNVTTYFIGWALNYTDPCSDQFKFIFFNPSSLKIIRLLHNLCPGMAALS